MFYQFILTHLFMYVTEFILINYIHIMRISFNNFKKIKANLIVGENLISQAKNSSLENFKYGFDDTFIQKLIERME